MANAGIEALRHMAAGGRVVFFGGAGVSTESGIPDFRSPDGLYGGAVETAFPYPPEIMLSHDFFTAHPDEFYAFYRARVLAPNAKPNPAHIALARMEAAGLLTAVVTQNIDGLHQAAGSENVLELHGSAWRNTCTACGRAHGLNAILAQPGVPRCACGGMIRPNVVLYGEGLDENTVAQAVRAMAGASTLIIGGTSLAVYPAAGLVDYFTGQNLVMINKTPTGRDCQADLLFDSPIGEVLGALCADM